MTITSSLTSTSASTSSNSTSSTDSSQTLSQSDFLQLLVTQMTNQDPTSPMDSQQMVAQLAQISQVSATTNLQTSVDNLLTTMRSNQVSSASSLIGHTVTVPTQQATLSNGSLIGAVQVPSGGGTVQVQVQITDPSTGKVVRTLNLDSASEGLVGFSWDGVSSDGTTLADGSYQISASVDGQSATTYTAGTVQGVGNDSSGNYVQVSGVGNVSLSDVAQVN
jgi:flagellar basal-body rod modification protein FlgD